MRKKLRVVTGCDSEDEEEDETKEQKYPRISYRQLREATGGFSASSLIGSDRFDGVYKGVLLDNTRVAVKVLDTRTDALVTDFGISRLAKGYDKASTCNNSTSFSSTHGLLFGSVGYIAPEYGMGKHASTEGDVYSFGVILLEIVTDKLKNIVEEALQRCRLSCVPSHDTKGLEDVMLELIELGILCTQQNTSTRPTMIDVAQEMGRLKDYLINSIRREDNLIEN
ncbi:hypothetical protein P8452_73033 [Trifolium repens]|nr:hypothetical protein P8452_73033 [Trifolium repens]